MRLHCLVAPAALAGSMLLLLGCTNHDHPAKPKADHSHSKEPSADIKAARDKLSPEDRQLVDAQEYCAVEAESRLGEMGKPFKVMVKDQPVFLCCKSCQRRALADPEKTLAKVEELKNKLKADSEKK